MRSLTTPADIKLLGTILSVWAHPDDETFTSAGIMTTAIQNGQRVVCVTATKGEEGCQDELRWPRERLGDIRTQELAEALRIMGVTEHHYLGCFDGECKSVEHTDIIPKLQAIVESVKPDTILTFGPEGLTGHPDHQTVSGWVDEVVEFLPSKPVVYHVVEEARQYEKYLKQLDEQFDIYFAIDQPPLVLGEEADICLELTPALKSSKVQALAAMPSQYEKMLRAIDNNFNNIFAYEVFIRADRVKHK